MLKLDRPYQTAIKQATYQAWAEGKQNVFWVMPTGSGKTHTFTSLIAEHDGHRLVVAHRNQLLAQTSCDLASKGVSHSLIASSDTIRSINALHIRDFGRSFHSANALTHVGSVDTLARRGMSACPFPVSLLAQDEAHHVLRGNKWGAIARAFPNARGVYPTATPKRADGAGLGRNADGVGDVLLHGPSTRELINQGYLSRYRIFCPQSNIDLSQVNITPTGDFNSKKLSVAVHESKITGSVVDHYIRLAGGKLGLTFAVDIEAAQELCDEYNRKGVPAAVITANTDTLMRYELIKQFKARKLLQLVSVDVLGEGTDIPAVEVVSLARPTQSIITFLQQVGRVLRIEKGKEVAIIIDHVGNVMRHGLPDDERIWTLDRALKKAKSEAQIQIRECLNPHCMAAFMRYLIACPECGWTPTPQNRSAPEFVEGDLIELDLSVIRGLQGEINRIKDEPHPPSHLDASAQGAIKRNHYQRQQAQAELHRVMGILSGVWHAEGLADREIQKKFWLAYGCDVLTAQTFNAAQAEALTQRIKSYLIQINIFF